MYLFFVALADNTALVCRNSRVYSDKPYREREREGGGERGREREGGRERERGREGEREGGREGERGREREGGRGDSTYYKMHSVCIHK